MLIVNEKRSGPPPSLWFAAGTKPSKKLYLYPICMCTRQGREEWAFDLTQKPK